MTAKQSTNEFDVIVIGSGMGGMTTATALSQLDYKVLLLEQAQQIGGLTHTITRDGFSWMSASTIVVLSAMTKFLGTSRPGRPGIDWRQELLELLRVACWVLQRSIRLGQWRTRCFTT